MLPLTLLFRLRTHCQDFQAHLRNLLFSCCLKLITVYLCQILTLVVKHSCLSRETPC